MAFIYGLIYFLFLAPVPDQQTVSKNQMLAAVNNLRKEGCYCGRKKMRPVAPLTWNDKLYNTALAHAKDMTRYNYFSHISKSGKDVGQRAQKMGYSWVMIGENIASGQQNINQAMEDWIKSRTHCKMLMNPDMEEIGMAKYGTYWVQNFGKAKYRR